MKTVYIVLTFCAGLLLGYLIFPSHHETGSPGLGEIAKTETRLHSIDTIKQAGDMRLQKENGSLVRQLAVINTQLVQNKSRLLTERNKVMLLTEQLKGLADSLIADSLTHEILAMNETTDSIIRRHEQRDTLLESMVAIRDSQIVLCNQSYQSVKDLIREQERRQQQLTVDLNTALKENKRTRFRNRLLAAGMLFTSGLVTTLLIKSK